jgi:arylsulfatase A-like enzyme
MTDESLESTDRTVPSTPSTNGNDQPNVLFILVDDLGYSDIGCYGGEITTPNLDRLAENGAQFSEFYVQPRCSPTRASLLTGHTNQRLGFDVLTGDSELRRNHVFLPELLGENGYRTYLSGKWHLGGTANFGVSDVERDPRVRGFDHVYRFTGYAESPWDPDTRLLSHTPDTYRLLSDAVEERSYRHDPDSTQYEQGESFYQTDAITDYALDFLEHDRHQNETEDHQPFFMYLAYGAPHFPLAAPQSLTEKYVSKYEAGWDTVREDRLQRMIERGVVPPDVVLPSRSNVPGREDWDTHQVRAWNTLSEERQADLARRMAVFAAMVEMIDRNVGRVLDDLEGHDQLENTLVLFMSDNGACYEWHEFGHSANDGPRSGDTLATMGTAAADQGLKYGAGWANAGSTPYRLYKHFGHEGGIRTPLVVHWEGLDDDLREGIVDGVGCSRDVMPTILDLLDIDLPETWTAENGETYAVDDFDETNESLRDLLVGGEMLNNRDIAWEHEGNAAYRSGSWKLVGKNFESTDGVPAYAWELYDLTDDPTETNDVADDHPEQVREFAEHWMDWAERNDVTVPESVTISFDGE